MTKSCNKKFTLKQKKLWQKEEQDRIDAMSETEREAYLKEKAEEKERKEEQLREEVEARREGCTKIIS